MTDTSASSELNKTTVAATANQCLESFQRCLLREPSLHPRELSMVEDQVARFSTWTSGIGVFAPGRASMDHRLRYAPEVQSTAIGLLESLNYRIRKFSEVLDKHAKGPETLISSVLDDGLGRFLGDIATEISHLNKMSNIIRRASQENHNIQAKDFHLKDEDGNDVEPLLLDHYKRYIGDRFPMASVTIQQRLADAMILRRKRILYKRFRHGNKTIQLPQLDTKVSITMPNSHPRQGDNQRAIAPSRIQTATTLQPDKFKMIASSPSIVSTTMTVALGNHEALDFPLAPGLQVKRKYEQLKAEKLVAHQSMLERFDGLFPATDSTLDPDDTGKDASERISTENDLRNTLKSVIQAIGEITCPYCLFTLPLEEVFNKQKWHNHVKYDLDPYVCLFEECKQPDELYKHSEKWLGHMHQHGQRWRCPSHRELGLFLSSEEYMQHMRDVHDTKLNDAKLRALANRNARTLPKLFPSCPLCGKDESDMDGCLTDHITGHLRSLAIRSLPCHYDDMPGDVGSEYDSSNSSQPRGRSTIDLSDDEDIRKFWSTRDEHMDDLGPDPSQHTTTASERIPPAARPPDSPMPTEPTKQQAEEVLRVSQAMPSTAVDSTNDDGEGVEDKFLRGGNTSHSQIEGKQREESTPLHIEAIYGTLTSLDPYKTLPHFNLEATDHSGRTALACAALMGNVNVVKLLISEGASANSIDNRGRTALWYASHSHSSVTKQQRREIIEHLLHNGADPNVQATDGTTALMNLIKHREPGAMKLLLEWGADPPASDYTRVYEEEMISSELRDEQVEENRSIRVEFESIAGSDMDSADTEMWNSQANEGISNYERSADKATHSKDLQCEAEPFCFELFKDNKARNRHYLVSHKEYAIGQGVVYLGYVCGHCQEPFSRKDNLRRHFRRHHSEDPERGEGQMVINLPTYTSTTSTVESPSKNSDRTRKMQEAPEEELYTIKCICNFSEDDGNTIYCDTCDTWQHIDCYYPENREEAIREGFSHSCADCKPRALNRQKAIERILRFRNSTMEPETKNAHNMVHDEDHQKALALQESSDKATTSSNEDMISKKLQLPQQQSQQPLSQQQQIAIGMANQAGRGIKPNQQAMGVPGAPNRPSLTVEMAGLGPADMSKVNDLATKLMNQATEQQRANVRLHLQSRLSAQQLAEFHAQAKDPLLWWYQHQAFQALKLSSLNSRFQQGGPAN